MTLQELGTAVQVLFLCDNVSHIQAKACFMLIVFNNGCLKRVEESVYTNIFNPDYEKLADAYGSMGITVCINDSAHLSAALHSGLAHVEGEKGFAIINVMMDPDLAAPMESSWQAK